jgi:hypothetical protein
MTTYLEALPASKTHGTHRRVRWTPCEGVSCECSGRLEISQGRRGQDSVTYALTEFYADAGFGAGRAVRVVFEERVPRSVCTPDRFHAD